MAGNAKFYFDEMMSQTAAKQLVQRGYSVTMAADVGMTDKDDDVDHLPYAITNGLVLVTFDRPFASRTMARTDHPGLVCLSCPQDDIGCIVTTLSEFAELYDPEKDARKAFWL